MMSHSDWQAALATYRRMQLLQSACRYKEWGPCTNGPPVPWTATLPESGGSWPQDIPPPWSSPLPSFFPCILNTTVPDDQKLADSVHINSDMRHVCLQLLTAVCQARPLSNSCSAHSQQQQILGSCCADWHTPNHCYNKTTNTVAKQHARPNHVSLPSCCFSSANSSFSITCDFSFIKDDKSIQFTQSTPWTQHICNHTTLTNGSKRCQLIWLW